MVSACILYFSQTGNTEKVAYTIAGRFQGEGVDNVTLHLEDARTSRRLTRMWTYWGWDSPRSSAIRPLTSWNS